MRFASINPFGVYEIWFKIKPDSADHFWRLETKGKGEYDAWHSNFVSEELLPREKMLKKRKYLNPDNRSTLSGGLQCSSEIITVGSYVNKVTENPGQDLKSESGNISGFSSLGPTRKNNIKPDVIATGENIISCAVTNADNSKEVKTQNPLYTANSGTSFSSAVVTGWAALYLQKNPTATNREVKSILIKTAFKDKFTGTRLPDAKSGYGKVDGFKAFSK